LVAILSEALEDQANSWELRPDGSWHRVAPGPGPLGRDVQSELQAAALASVRSRRESSPPVPSAVRAAPRPVPGDVVFPQPVPARTVPTGASVPVGAVVGAAVEPPATSTTPAPRWWRRLFRRGR
jgi:hypothetical protein